MRIESIVVGPLQSNCFIVFREGAGEAVVVDPGADVTQIVGVLRKHRLTPSAYWLTHGHMDHVSALADLCRPFPAPVAMHADDWPWAFTEANAFPPFFPQPPRPSGIEERTLKDGDVLTDAGLRCRVLGTPGHTPGSVCFHFEDSAVLLSGDTLFSGGGVGRTDLPGGDGRALGNSLRRLASLPDNTRLYCGHGPPSTLGREKKLNYYLQRLAG